MITSSGLAKKPNTLRNVIGLLIATGIAGVPIAQAQNAGGMALEEIVVTSRKKSEDLQSTPVAVTAFTENGLENRGITNNLELGLFTPNVVIDNTSAFAGIDTFQAFIRGVGQGDFALNTDPGVGLYIDDVYYARAPAAVTELMDIERIEVLKGPQGTLFGRNSIGGAVHIITKRPSEQFEFKGNVTMGQRDRKEVNGVVNIPLIEDSLYGSVAFRDGSQDGYQTRIPFGGTAGLGGPSSDPTAIPLDQLLVSDFGNGNTLGSKSGSSVRGKLLWLASDNVEVTFIADSTTKHDAANPTTLVEVDPNFALGGLYNACIAGVPGLPCLSNFLQTGANADGTRPDLQYTPQFITGDIDTTYGTGANYANMENDGLSATVNWQPSDDVTVKSITAYRDVSSTFGLDIDSSPLAFDQTSFILNTEQYSQEFQLTANLTDRFDVASGVYYYKEDGYQSDNVPIAGGLIQAGGGFDHDTEAFAIFGEGNFSLTDNVNLLFGARYTEEEKTLQLDQKNLNTEFSTLGLNLADLPRPSAPEFLGPEQPLKEKFDNTSVRLGINWQVTDDFYTYFTFSQGFKSGGFTTRLTTFFSDALIAAADPNDPAVLRQLDFGEETSDNFELGFKSNFLDNRIRLNGAIFQNTYEDIQIVVQRGVSPSNENLAEAEINGLELELEAIPTDWLLVNASLGYLDAEYTKIDPAAAPLLFNRFGQQITTNTELQNTPEWTGSLALNINLSDALTANLNVSYTSRVENDVFNTPQLSQDDYTLVGASLKYEPSDNWSVILGGINLTDERYIISGFEAGSLPFTMASYSSPREWYLTVGYSY